MKKQRQNKIIELIEKYDITTQEELACRLEEEGFDVTQSTISRDIHQMHLTKIPAKDGQSKYVRTVNIVKQGKEEPQLENKYFRVLKDGFASVDMASNLLVVKTVPGMAMAVAAAIDAMCFEEIVGSIAGDDTIMIAVRSVQDNQILMEKMNRMILDNFGEHKEETC